MPRKQNSIPVFVNQRVVGVVRGDVFRKTIIGSRHLLKRPLAIAMDTAALRKAEQAGARKVVVFDRESTVTYTASVDRIRERGFPVNRGYGEQLALMLDDWTVSGKAGAGKQLSFLESPERMTQ